MPQLATGFTAAIANGQTTSGAIALAKTSPAGIYMPAAFTGTALTFLACDTLAGTYLEITKVDGSAYTVTVAASKYVPLDPAYFGGVRFLKIKSGSTEGGARSLTVVSKI